VFVALESGVSGRCSVRIDRAERKSLTCTDARWDLLATPKTIATKDGGLASPQADVALGGTEGGGGQGGSD